MSAIKPNRARTFTNDRNYRIAFDNNRRMNFIVTQDQNVIGLENPSILLLAQELGFAPKKSSVLDEMLNGGNSKTTQESSQNANFIREGGLLDNTIQAVRDVIQDPQGSLDKVRTNAMQLAQGSIRPAKQVAFAVPRQAFLGLVALNYQGFATKYYNRSETDRRKIIDMWEDKWGGGRGSLEGSFSTGKNKTPLFISKKKRVEYLQLQKSQLSFANIVDPISGATVGLGAVLGWIAVSLGIILTLIQILKVLKPVNPQIDAQVDRGQEDADREDGEPSINLRTLEYEELKAQINTIQANPNLTQEQKNALIQEIQSVMPTYWERNKTWIIIGIGGVALIGVLAYLLTQRQKTN